MNGHKIHTESEHLTNNQWQMHKLARLYQKDPLTFKQICNYLPFSVYLNHVKSLDLVMANEPLQDEMERDQEEIIYHDHSLVRKISDPHVLSRSLSKIRRFEKNHDKNAICTYVQRLELRQLMTWTLTYKSFIDNLHFLNLMHRLDRFGEVGIFLQNTLDQTFVRKGDWDVFLTLTKREKEILKLLAYGLTSKEIAYKLNISKLTADTHRRNLLSKVNCKTFAELLKYAHALDLLE